MCKLCQDFPSTTVRNLWHLFCDNARKLYSHSEATYRHQLVQLAESNGFNRQLAIVQYQSWYYRHAEHGPCGEE